MSLQYIIDGYNVINQPDFVRLRPKSNSDQAALLSYIVTHRLTGSPNNRVIVVFDGFPVDLPQDTDGIQVVFSRSVSADEKIIETVEKSENPRNIIVVSNDSAIRSAAKAEGARVISVADFIRPKKSSRPGRVKEEDKDMPGYTDRQRIDEELRRLWLE